MGVRVKRQKNTREWSSKLPSMAEPRWRLSRFGRGAQWRTACFAVRKAEFELFHKTHNRPRHQVMFPGEQPMAKSKSKHLPWRIPPWWTSLPEKDAIETGVTRQSSWWWWRTEQRRRRGAGGRRDSRRRWRNDSHIVIVVYVACKVLFFQFMFFSFLV